MAHLRYAALLLGLATVYLGAAKLGLSMGFAAEQVTAVWPPTGIALAAVLLLGYRAWPGIWLGAFLANVTTNEPVVTAGAIAVGNTLEALAGGWLLRRVVGFGTTLDEVRHVVGLIGLAAVASTTISATVGTSSLVLTGVHPWAAFGDIWRTWWIGDAMGDLVVAPALLTWAAGSHRAWWHRRDEALLLLAALVATGALVLIGPLRSILGVPPPSYLVFPFVVWGALRFGQFGATTVTFIASIFAIWETIRRSDPSAAAVDVEQSLILLQVFLGIVAMSGLLLAAAVDQWKRAATGARQSEERLRRALDSAGTGTWSYNVPTGEVTWSESLEMVHGLRPGGFGGTFEAYLQDIHPDDRDRVARAIAGSIESGEYHDVHYRIVRPDGSVRWIHGRGQVIRGATGRPLSMTGLCTDITDRKRVEDALQESEARLRGIIESAMDAVITIDGNERITLFNPAAERMFRCKCDEVVGTSLERFIPAAVREVHHRHIEEFGMAGVTSRTMGTQRTLTAVRSDGEEFPMEATISQTVVGSRKLYTVLIRDVTERVRADQERERFLAREVRAHAELEASTRAKDEFLAMLGHELRNPLGALSTAVTVLNRVSGPDDRTAKPREIITRQVGHLARLVGRLLDLSRLDSGKLDLRLHAVDLRDVVERCVTAFCETGKTGQHQIEVTGSPVLVGGDAVRLEEVVNNLVDNALKYTPPGGRIAVAVTRDGQHAVLRVRDTGVGIAPERLSRIFDPFVQADTSLHRSQGGLGLGLALVTRLVALHSGAVSASSPGPGQGSEFIVRLPLLEGPPRTPERAPKDRGPSAPRRVLVIEDNTDARDALGVLLKIWGHHVEVAEDGTRGLERLLAFRPDIALIDIGLPGLDGYALAREVRASPGGASMYLVALTGYGQPHDRRQASAAGFDAHLVKPADEQELLGVLAAAPSSGGG